MRMMAVHKSEDAVVEFEPIENIIAIITEDRNLVGGNAPIFYAKNAEERTRIALYISRVTLGMVHDLGNGVYVIVKH